MKTIAQSDIQNIIYWFKVNQKDYPWRRTSDPYIICISEIMLQQTRITAVLPKFLTFVQELPNLDTLATCDDDKLMKLWEGLGYYSRARNLKKCAITIKENYNGIFPSSKKELMKLPGIGFYTAGAIATTCFGEKVSAIDGNVLRVLARYFSYTKDIRDKEALDHFDQIIVSSLEQTHLDALSIRYFTQGLMEIGETICIAKGEPNCSICPLHQNCIACKNHSISSIPYRSKLKDKKIIDKTVLIIRYHHQYLIHKRDNTGLLANLYEFPNIDLKLAQEEVIAYLQKYDLTVQSIHPSIEAKHIFTHLEWHMNAYEIEVSDIHQPLQDHYSFVTREEIAKLSFPSAFNAYLRYYHLR